MAEGTAEAARTMRSEGAIENEAASGELLDTAKVNSTATAGGAGWEERTFAGTMSWEEMVEKVRRETRYVSAACARRVVRHGGNENEACEDQWRKNGLVGLTFFWPTSAI